MEVTHLSALFMLLAASCIHKYSSHSNKNKTILFNIAPLHFYYKGLQPYSDLKYCQHCEGNVKIESH